MLRMDDRFRSYDPFQEANGKIEISGHEWSIPEHRVKQPASIPNLATKHEGRREGEERVESIPVRPLQDPSKRRKYMEGPKIAEDVLPVFKDLDDLKTAI